MNPIGRLVACTALALVTPFATRAQQQPQPSEQQMRGIAARIADLEFRRQLVSATPATVDSLLALYADSVVYEHPNARAVIRGKNMMRDAMAQYIGTVRALDAERPRVTIGHGVAIVETRAKMEILDRGKWVSVTRNGIRVIEFNQDGLVRRLIDYPW